MNSDEQATIISKGSGGTNTGAGKYTAIVAGASGLVGSELLKLLIANNSYSSIHVFVRQIMKTSHAKIVQHVVDFNKTKEWAALLKGDHVFVTIGTTIKQSGSREKFMKVDFDYVNDMVRHAQLQGCKKALIVTALGANAKSWVFYNQVKGRVEQAISRLTFQEVHFFRPSLLLGSRAEVRAGEKFAIAMSGLFSFLFVGPLSKYKPIHARKVAQSMIRSALGRTPGVHYHESDEMQG